MALRLLLATKRLPPGGVWLKGAGRGPQKVIGKIAEIAKIENWNAKSDSKPC
jgi:hypothetical protein